MGIALKPFGKGHRTFNVPVDGGSALTRGYMVSQLTSTGMTVAAGTASSGPAIGIAEHDQDNADGSDGDLRANILSDGIFVMANAGGGDACTEALSLFSVVYIYNAYTVADNSNGGARQPAGLYMGLEPNGDVRVFFGFRLLAQAEAGLISIADAGLFTDAATVEEAIQELYQNALTAGGFIPISLRDFREVSSGGDVGNIAANGGVLASDTTPILRADANESEEIAWAAAEVDGVSVDLSLPKDLDDTAAMTVDLFVASGATDAASFSLLSSFNKGAQVTDSFDDSATKSATFHIITATIAAADIPANAICMTLQLVPPAHAADAILLGAARVNYKKKLLTS
jgi:hypothetical protein